MLKYTINYDGMYGSFAKIHSENRYADESLALPENVLDRFKKSKEHADVYIFDRGQSSAEAFDRMRSTFVDNKHVFRQGGNGGIHVSPP